MKTGIETVAIALGLIATQAFADTAVAQSSPPPAPHPTSARPIGRPGAWISDYDYPKTAVRDHVEGDVGFMLTVAADGTISACEIMKSSGNADLDATTCELIKARAHFQPATNAAGVNTTGIFRSSVRWRLPDSAPGRSTGLPSGQSVVAYDVLPDGTTANCTLTVTGEMASRMPQNAEQGRCAQIGLYVPQVDATGKPIKKHYVITETIAVTTLP